MADIVFKTLETDGIPEIGKPLIIKYEDNDAQTKYAEAHVSKVYNNNNTGNDYNLLAYFAKGVDMTVKSIRLHEIVGYAEYYEGWESDIPEVPESREGDDEPQS